MDSYEGILHLSKLRVDLLELTLHWKHLYKVHNTVRLRPQQYVGTQVGS